jgi:predicted membrane channel-forming protein YqfA (hemolysin III family)
MLVFGGFVTALGIAAFAIAFTVLAAIPPAAIAVAFLGGVALTVGVGLFAKGFAKKEEGMMMEPMGAYASPV